MEKDVVLCKIIATSDVHGHLRGIDYRTNEQRASGLAMLAAYIRQEKEASPDLLLIDNGDLLQGAPLASYAAMDRRGGTHPFIAVLNKLGYDAAVIGNHEFNYGLDFLKQAVDGSRFPWLAANIVDRSTGAPAFGKPYRVKEAGGAKIALLGLTTHYIPNWENPKHIAGLEFRDALETAKEWVSRMRREEQPDVLIVSYHGGFERDLQTGEETERQTGENQGYAICCEVEGIDVLITGHQHRMLTGEINGVTIVQPGSGGQAAAKVEVALERKDGRFVIVRKQAELLLPDAGRLPDQEVLALTDALEAATQQWLDEPIGSAAGDLSISSAMECRLEAHPFIQFIHEVQLEATGAELSNAALLSEDSPGFGTDITMRDVLSNFIYPNTLTVLRLSGEDIRLALEQTAAYFDLDEDGNVIVSRAYLEPKPQHYNYDMWAGIDYVLNVSRPVGKRVAKLERNGEPLRPDQYFDVVMSNYRSAGGGDYEMYRGKPVVREGADDVAALAAEYIRRKGTIAASRIRNWRVVTD
ncbi:bifunctional metallophosphatase/5'-nucleotidase [Paenibacillus protaetiae]|uniref:Bifunctional metallophosphatase/5'-nucleotidase n=1 Tax=Paenibacillus protaetiae TaxID=2509456 RepID=A0A4P6EYM7_9BACL|nr:bifunctional UDP-sugar hydrolase/5'-nucleotidase [Paenibacillus protaetiae]QAY67956.1 bifunctional metallophosphatase/5'-nucleotidase [Paenibacillus protaetiae]